MDRQKEKQEISLVGRLFSLEALLILMGVLSLVSGILSGDPVRLLLGAAILSAFFLLIVIRRRAKRK